MKSQSLLSSDDEVQGYLTVVALGASLGGRQEKLVRVGSALYDMHQGEEQLGEVLECSTFYVTEPWGGRAQNLFINGACLIRSILEPLQQLSSLQNIEKLHGRRRGKMWQDRTLDLDLLWIEDHRGQCVESSSASLLLPHPGLKVRGFMWYPFCELLAATAKRASQDQGVAYDYVEKVGKEELRNLWSESFVAEKREFLLALLNSSF